MSTRRARGISDTWAETFSFYRALKTPTERERQFRFRNGHLRFYVRPVDFCALEEVMLNEEYSFVAPLITAAPAASVVVDAGANIGLFSLTILAARRETNVYSLEPSTGTFAVLQRNVKVSGLPNWRAFNLALWGQDGEVVFRNTADASTSSRIENSATGDGTESVPACKLPTFIHRHSLTKIFLLKLDIEGAEEAVLVNGESALDQVENLIVEIHPAVADEEKIFAILRKHFPRLLRVPGRRSSKPLILASRASHRFPFENSGR